MVNSVIQKQASLKHAGFDNFCKIYTYLWKKIAQFKNNPREYYDNEFYQF